MKKVKQCLILAAGNGTRLRPLSAGLPKPLVQFRGKPILEHVILRARLAGIDEFVIVVGYRSDLIRRWLESRWLGDVSVKLVENPDYHKHNGVSVLKAREEMHENFLLLMADHVFEPETARVLMAKPLVPGEVILAVDPKIDRVFDLEDATKVRRQGELHCGYREGDPHLRCARYRNVPVQPGVVRQTRFINDEWQLLAFRWHAPTGSRTKLARLRDRRGPLARCGYSRGPGPCRERVRWAFPTGRLKDRSMSNAITRLRLPLRMLAGMFGVLLLAFLVRRTGTSTLRESIAAIGWGLSLVIALTGVSHVLKTWAWRITLLDEKRHVSFSRMLGLRLGSEAAGQLGFLGQMFGENLRVSLLSSTMSPASRIASVTLDRALFVLSAAAVSIAGLVMMLFVGPLPRTLSLYASLFASILLGALLTAALAVRKRWAVFSGTAELVGRVPYFRAWIDRKRSLICSVEHKLLDFYHHTPGAFWGSLALNLACQGAAVLEVYLILFLVGAKIGILASLAMEGLTKLVNLLGVFNPGNLGTYEGGNMLIGSMFGFSGVVGLSLALTRRVRAIFWAAVGCVCLVILAKSRRHISNERTDIPMRVSKTPTLAPETPTNGRRSHLAVILAHDLPCYNIANRNFPRLALFRSCYAQFWEPKKQAQCVSQLP